MICIKVVRKYKPEYDRTNLPKDLRTELDNLVKVIAEQINNR